jgi:hypothetical protein
VHGKARGDGYGHLTSRGLRGLLVLALLGLAPACPEDANDGAGTGPACEIPAEATFAFTRDPVTGGPVRWPSGAVVLLGVAEEGAKTLEARELLAPVAAAAAAWGVVGCAAPRLELAGTAPAATFGFDREADAQQSLLVWVADESDWRSRHSESAIAVTSVFTELATGRILDADVELNDFSGYAWTLAEAGAGADVQTLVAHELGHVLGLAHDRDPGALMAVGWEPGRLRRAPKETDEAALCTLYRCFPLEPQQSPPARSN